MRHFSIPWEMFLDALEWALLYSAVISSAITFVVFIIMLVRRRETRYNGVWSSALFWLWFEKSIRDLAFMWLCFKIASGLLVACLVLLCVQAALSGMWGGVAGLAVMLLAGCALLVISIRRRVIARRKRREREEDALGPLQGM